MSELLLLDGSGRTRTESLREVDATPPPSEPLRSRVVYAAAHVIPRVHGQNTPGAPADIDWDATLAFRHHLWSHGLGVADAMDTAQRNMGLDPPATRELIRRSAAAAQAADGAVVVGVNTDDVEEELISLDSVVDAYVRQLEFAEDAGAGVVLMASRHLARAAQSAADYEQVYGAVLERAGAPVILHWLGEAFDPVLRGYFGAGDEAAATLIRIIEAHPEKVAGVKMSLLDAGAEIDVRSRLPRTTAMFTGDDFHSVDLIRGDGTEQPGHFSHALLGAFAAIAPLAGRAVRALDAGDGAAYEQVLRPTEALARQIFAAPTFYYKTGIAFLSWLNGRQASPAMVGGLQSARSLPHLSEVVRLANLSGALEDPRLAADRWHGLLALNGVVK